MCGLLKTLGHQVPVILKANLDSTIFAYYYVQLAYIMTSQQTVSCKLTHDIRTTHVHVVHENGERVDGRKPWHKLVAYDSCKQKSNSVSLSASTIVREAVYSLKLYKVYTTSSVRRGGVFS